MNWIDRLPKYLFFTGKGGVGKTSLASATAVRLADEGERVLLVSTDPASNLEHVFGVKVDAHKPTPVPEVPGLELLNIDPEEAVEAYRERVVGPVRGVLPEKSIRGIEEQLSGACTMEIAAFDEFTELLTLPEKTSEYKHVVFDTAPTGHTLRLLQLPSAWSGFLESNQSGASCLGPLAGLERQQSQYSEAVSVLSDLNRVRMILVSRLQESALQEAARTSKELLRLGIANQQLILNAVMPETASQDPLARSLIRRERQAEARMPEALRSLPTNHVRLQPNNLVGVGALRSMFATSKQTAFQASTRLPEELPASQLGEMVDQIAATGHGLIMVMGQGGVGKTRWPQPLPSIWRKEAFRCI